MNPDPRPSLTDSYLSLSICLSVFVSVCVSVSVLICLLLLYLYLSVSQLQLQDYQRMVQGRIRSGEREIEEFQQSLESLKVKHTL